MNYDYEYFSGANVTIRVKSRDSEGDGEKLIECAGISYSVSTSRQPVYGYNSVLFDTMLPGRVIIQGTLVVNYTKPNSLEKLIYGKLSGRSNPYNGESFDIAIKFGNKSIEEKLVDCYLISSGKTIQISEQVILEEYSFLAKHKQDGSSQTAGSS